MTSPSSRVTNRSTIPEPSTAQSLVLEDTHAVDGVDR